MELSRRKFFTHFGKALVDGMRRRVDIGADSSSIRQKQNSPPNDWVRPPGALSEEKFLETCTRCTDCQTACPYDSIRRLGPEFGFNAGTPAIIPHESPCYLCPDMPCIEACAPKALIMQPVADLSMGLAVLNRGACYLAQGQPCDYCLKRCPLKSEAITLGDNPGAPGPIINPDGCVGCGVCVYLCPADALAILNENVDITIYGEGP